MNPKCRDCKFAGSTNHRLLSTSCWNVWLPNNQAYCGRACLTLRTHKSSLSELNETEWQEFEELVKQLESVYAKTLGAKPLNWGCFMNNAFREEPAHPHVHWHLFPRYKKAPTIGDITFDDQLYGEHYDPNAEKIVSDGVVEKIIEKLKEHLSAE